MCTCRVATCFLWPRVCACSIIIITGPNVEGSRIETNDEESETKQSIREDTLKALSSPGTRPCFNTLYLARGSACTVRCHEWQQPCRSAGPPWMAGWGKNMQAWLDSLYTCASGIVQRSTLRVGGNQCTQQCLVGHHGKRVRISAPSGQSPLSCKEDLYSIAGAPVFGYDCTGTGTGVVLLILGAYYAAPGV